MMEAAYRGRKAVQIENSLVRVTVTTEGAHIAEILHKVTGVNPLWTPHWPSIEPSVYNPQQNPEYGSGNEAHLLSGILGHNVCLDVFGAPSDEEARAGIPLHGEAGLAAYNCAGGTDWLELRTVLTRSQIRFSRRLRLTPDTNQILIEEEVENLTCFDRPIAWTQHVTLGAPFLQRGQTRFQIPATRSKVADASFNDGQGGQLPDAEFDWPLCPRKNDSVQDLRVYPAEPVSAGLTSHLLDPTSENAWFLAWSPESKVLIGYKWRRVDFPWLVRWEENHLRTQAPWNAQGLTCGMEFGVSPTVESRRAMVTRGSLFGVPAFRWLPAKSTLRVSYAAFIGATDSMPETFDEATLNSLR